MRQQQSPRVRLQVCVEGLVVAHHEDLGEGEAQGDKRASGGDGRKSHTWKKALAYKDCTGDSQGGVVEACVAEGEAGKLAGGAVWVRAVGHLEACEVKPKQKPFAGRARKRERGGGDRKRE